MPDTADARLAGAVGLAHDFHLRSMALNQLNEAPLSITGRQRSSCAPAPGEEDARPLPVPAQTPLTLRRRAASRPESNCSPPISTVFGGFDSGIIF